MKYDYFIKTKKIIPPLGTNKFSAEAIIHEIGKGEVAHNIGESWGKTEDEARIKINEKIKQWLENNSK